MFESTVERRRQAPTALASPLLRYLERLHAAFAPLADGEVASYIPELARARPDWFGICLATPGGAVYEVGDTGVRFTLQSVSKPLTYGLALADLGDEGVRRAIGVEPSGDAFNAISLDRATGLPRNPMINAGAIAATGLVRAAGGRSRFERILHAYSAYAGRPLELDERVYLSERETGHRNRAIAHLLRAGGGLGEDMNETVDAYFRQCAVAVDCRDLAFIGATLANEGVNPLTGERALDHRLIRHVLSVMTTCGMYDFAGEWLFGVGLPAKSGVSGAVLAVLPGRVGIGVFSPPLDERGNSVRGVLVCTTIAANFDVHVLDGGRPAVSPVRASYTLAEVGSKRVRTPAERRALDEAGDATAVLEVQGELELSAFEQLAATALAAVRAPGDLVLDLTRVTRVEPGVVELLADLAEALAAAGSDTMLVTGMPFTEGLDGGVRTFGDRDAALETAEDTLLRRLGISAPGPAIALREHPALAELDDAGVERVAELSERRHVAAGEFLARNGDPADAIFLLTAGRASVLRRAADGTRVRAATLAAGALVGDLALADRAPRSADVKADTDIELFALPLAALDRLGAEAPRIEAALLRSALREASRTARRLEGELRAVTAPAPRSPRRLEG
jgi:glutaminase